MDITTKNRVDLKSYFVKNAIPTESNFADLIDAMLNLKEDGLIRQAGDPLSIEAVGDAASQKKVLNFYGNFTDDNPSWVLSLNPRSTPADPATAKPGFGINDGAGNNRLFIEPGTGNVGIGTNAPGQRFVLEGVANAERHDGNGMTNPGTLAIKSNAPQIDFIDTDGGDWAIQAGGGRMCFIREPWEFGLTLAGDGKVGIGTTTPSDPLHVMVAENLEGIRVSGTDPNLGIGLLKGTGDGATTTTYNGALDSWNGIAFRCRMDSTVRHTFDTRTGGAYFAGNVGIGAAEPGQKLVLEGNHAVGKHTGNRMTSGGALAIKSNAPQIDFLDTDADQKQWSIHVSDGRMYFIREPWDFSGLVLGGGGKVGIGTKTTEPTIQLAIGDADTGLQQQGENELAIYTSGGERVRIDASGKVGIGTNEPSHPFHVRADVTVGLFESTGTQACLRVTANDGIDNRVEFCNRGGGRLALWTMVGGDVLNITRSGNVGIGTTDPTKAKLVVNGSAQSTLDGGFAYFNRSSTNIGSASISYQYSIWASAAVAADQYHAFSDERIKNVIGVSDARRDLDTLAKLRITDFTHIDVIGKGDRPHKKLIAQQVRSVYPDAVSASADFIPDVYALAVSVEHDGEGARATLALEKAHGLIAGDTVRLMDDKEIHELEVIEVPDERRFTVAGKVADKVFVYGKRVDDFLTLDYDAIAMLNVSATQELARRFAEQSARLHRLEEEVSALREGLS
uniref:Chaperone of endosialidase n=1 Tax=Candidatus Kentrum sp. DK TaxID=2126562 RepID=A0A450RV82_9GAMM|nr:MAG: Chaperone of endosialidase [Candidatus Kentron sp. DK]